MCERLAPRVGAVGVHEQLDVRRRWRRARRRPARGSADRVAADLHLDLVRCPGSAQPASCSRSAAVDVGGEAAAAVDGDGVARRRRADRPAVHRAASPSDPRARRPRPTIAMATDPGPAEIADRLPTMASPRAPGAERVLPRTICGSSFPLTSTAAARRRRCSPGPSCRPPVGLTTTRVVASQAKVPSDSGRRSESGTRAPSAGSIAASGAHLRSPSSCRARRSTIALDRLPSISGRDAGSPSE